MREKKQRRKNNKGLTLVELVVTVAIIAIFSGIILSIVTTSSNTFRSTSNTAKVQMKTQELLDTIQDLVIDANRSIYYEIGNQKIENDIDGADVNIADMTSKRTFYVCNLSKDETALEYDIIRWDPLTKEVRYSWKSVPVSESEPGGGTESAFAADGEEPDSVGGNGDDTGVNGTADTGAEPEEKSSLLAENVTSFRADVTKVKGLRIVRFRIVMNEKGKEITTLHTVNLRNEIQILPPDVNFPDVPEIDIKVRIEGEDTCFVGDKKAYYAVVVGDFVPGSEEWSVDKPELANIDANGMLTAKAEGEVTITLTVYDTKGNPHTAEKKVTIQTKPEIPEENTEYKIKGPTYVTAEETYKIWDTWKLIDGTGNEVVVSTDNAQWTCSDSSVSIKDSWDKGGSLAVSANAKEFELELYVPSYSSGLQNPDALHLSYNVKVVKLTDLAPAEETHKIGDTVNFTPTVTVADVPVSANDPVFKELSSNWELNDVAQSGLNWGQTASWTIGADALAENTVTLQMLLGGRMVYCPNAPATRMQTSVIKIEEINFGLELDGPLAIEVKEDGARKNLSDYAVYKVIEGQPRERYNGAVTWNCSGNDNVTIVNGQIVIDPAAWSAPDGPGIFVLWATVQRPDGTTAVSNTLTVSIVRIKILAPSDGAIFALGNKVVVTVEYYVAHTFVRNYQLSLDGVTSKNEFTTTKIGEHEIVAEGNELGLSVSDSVKIRVLEEFVYTIKGSDIMPDTVARIKPELKYICNQKPVKDGDQATGSRMYWVEDNNGKHVNIPEANWTVVDNGGTVVFTVVVQDEFGRHVLTKIVDVASVNIIKPANIGIIGGNTYECEAQLTAGVGDGYRWSAAGGVITTNKEVSSVVVSKDDFMTLTVKTNVLMSNGIASYPYEISSSRTYVVQDKNVQKNWKLLITEVGDNKTSDGGIIHIPLNDKGTASTFVKMKITNPGDNDFTDKSTYMKWKLYIPELNLWLESGPIENSGNAVFPDGDATPGAGSEGFIEISQWTFPKEVIGDSLEALLFAESNANDGTGKKVSDWRNVICKVDGINEKMS